MNTERVSARSDRTAIATLVLGIASVVLPLLFSALAPLGLGAIFVAFPVLVLRLIVSALAIALGIAALRRSRRRAMAWIGIALGGYSLLETAPALPPMIAFWASMATS